MENNYLEILELQPGATRKEIKTAYRRLSKLYHPDVNKDEQAREKFIAIHEAYQFLTEVGPKPISYNNNPYADEYEQRRQRAREYARKKAAEATRLRNDLIIKILKGFNWALVVIITFNTLLAFDYLLPARKVTMPILGITKSFQMSRTGSTYLYDEIYFEDFVMRVNTGKVKETENYPPATVSITPLFHKPLSVMIRIGGVEEKIDQVYNVYLVFGYLIPFIFLLSILYFFLFKSLDHKLTISLIIVFMFIVQTFLFFIS